MISYLYSSTSLSQSSHPLALWDIDSSYLNGTFPFLTGLGSQPSQPSSHSVRGASKHCQSACAAPSPPFSRLLVYLGSREWWWAPSGKIAEGIVDGKDVMLYGNGDRGCMCATLLWKSTGHTGFFQQHLASTLLSCSCQDYTHLLSLHTFSLVDSNQQYFNHVIS